MLRFRIISHPRQQNLSHDTAPKAPPIIFGSNDSSHFRELILNAESLLNHIQDIRLEWKATCPTAALKDPSWKTLASSLQTVTSAFKDGIFPYHDCDWTHSTWCKTVHTDICTDAFAAASTMCIWETTLIFLLLCTTLAHLWAQLSQ